MSMAMIYTEFAKDIEKYLIGKLPEMPEHTAQEIGAHISNKMMICVNDMLREYDRELKWRMSKNAQKRRYESRESQKENEDENHCD